MGWYQCSCGFQKEVAPQLDNSIISVHHLHRSARVDGTSAIVRMEEMADSLPRDEARAPRDEGSEYSVRYVVSPR